MPSKMKAIFLFSIVTGSWINTTSAFQSITRIRLVEPSCHFNDFCLRQPTTLCSAADGSNNEESEEDEEGPEEGGLGAAFALPPIGASSFWNQDDGNDDAYADAFEHSDLARPPSNESNVQKNGIIISKHTSLVSPKFQLQYTCKVCSTRNSHSVTRVAYRNGVVIAFCKGCKSKHLIADNLGWSNYIGGFDFDNGERNIETYMKNRDREVNDKGLGGEKENDLVMRVNRDVFDLENILYRAEEGENVQSAQGMDGDGAFGDEKSWS